MSTKIAVQQTTSGGTIGPSTTYSSSGASSGGGSSSPSSYSAPSSSTPSYSSSPSPAPTPTPAPITTPTTSSAIDYTFHVGQETVDQYNQRIATAQAGRTATTPQNTTQQPTTTQTSTQQKTPLQMPASGSVVDLLTSAGQDSSFAARQQLAQQYGINSYTGTAAQNQELSKKYLDAFNAQKGAVPQSGAEARSALDTYFQGVDQNIGTPEQQFMDMLGAQNPVQAALFSQLSTLLSAQSTQQSFTELYQQEVAQQGIPALQMELADLNRIIDGSEDDIRAEVTAAGGFVTESQVQALTSARNKTLLRKANYLTDVLQMKNEYVDRIVSLTQADRQQVSEDLDRKLGITQVMISMADSMQKSAKENYTRIIDSVGWGGLAASVKGNPQQTAQVENLLGLAPGELEALGNYTKPLTEMEKLQIENAKLQNKKLYMDLNAGPAAPNLQFVGATGNQPSGVFNPKTGVFTPLTGTQDNTMRLAQAQSNIGSIGSLLSNGSLDAAVATNKLGSYSFPNLFTAGKSNFIAGVEQLRTQLTLDNLVNAKANGATFGALSEGELQLLNASASKLGSWAQKDAAGNVLYYKTNEQSFRDELDKINNFAKLDYVLKGGTPSSVGVIQQADGTFWTKNSNGTYTQLK